MKRIIFILTVTALAALAASPLMAAGVPPAINLQGRFTDAAGNNVADGVHTVVFRIYDDPIAGNTLWSETLPVQVTDGLFTVLVGNSTAIPADIFSNGADRYLGVTVNPEPELPRIPLNSVAYAYQTQDADVATLALDLTCVGCVSAGDIATNAVGALEIAQEAVIGGFHGDIADETITADDLAERSVGSGEIIPGAVSSGHVLNGSLLAVDIADEPGVASITEGASALALDGTVQILLSRSIVAPAAGYVLAIATAQVRVSHTLGTSSNANFGVSSSGVLPPNQDVNVLITSNAASGTYDQAVTVHGLFSTVGGGDVFFFLGQEFSGGFGGYSVSELQFTLIYFPTAYGTVVETAAPSGGEIISYEGAEMGPASPGIVGEPVQAQVAEGPRQGANSATSQQDQVRVNADLEARIQKLEELLRQNQSGTGEKK